jgi:hypothetical protein
MKPFFFIIVLLFSIAPTHANDTILVHKDARIDVLTTKQVEVNKRSAYMTSNGQYKGFRIQVANTQKRDDANKMKADLMRFFPEEKTYLMYQAPNFRVRIGNFLDRKEAEKFKSRITKMFPGKGIYIVPDVIDYTPKEDEELPVIN